MQIARAGEPPVLIEVKWYKAPAGAKTYRGINAFSSGIWDRDKPELPPLVGEQPPFARVHYNGVNEWGYIGQCFVGTADDFQFGLTAAELSSLPLSLPNCCQPQRGLAGLKIGGGERSTQGKFVGGGLKLGAGTFLDSEQPQGAGIKLGAGAPEQNDIVCRTGIKLGGGVSISSRAPQGAGLKLGGGSNVFSPLGYVLGCRALWRISFTGHAVGGGLKLGGGSTEGALPAGLKLGGGLQTFSPFGFVLGCRATWYVSYTGSAHGAGVLLGGGGFLDSEQPQGTGLKLGGGVGEPQGTGLMLGTGTSPFAFESGGGIILGGGEFPAYYIGYVLGCRATWSVH